ncbi:MAG: C40 family peptidase [Mediterranea sp.]|jgi:SH3-like domain-containing protein|nr:C40 family peptidase [Mediterranea sp.]
MTKKRLILILLYPLFLVAAMPSRAQDAKPTEATAAYGVVRVSVCNLREEGRFTSGMSTQALMGMPVEVLRYDGWYEVRTPDDYTGWAHRLTITPMTEAEYRAWNRAEKVVVTAIHGMVHSRPDERAPTVSDVVAGCRLRWEGNVGQFYRVGYPDGRKGYLARTIAQREKQWRASLRHDARSILRTARSLTGIPYLWAGTSTKGMDCSGFVRTVLLMHDIIIPRDTWQQARVGKRLETGANFENLLPGDLLFFGQPADGERKESISHVAFYLGDKRFIHALGDVHVGSLDPADKEYDAQNAGRLLFATRFLPYINKEKEVNTTDQNPYYQ